MRYYSLSATSGHRPGRARRRAAVTAVLAVGGVLAGMVPAMAAHAGAWHRPLVFHPPRVVYGGVPAGHHATTAVVQSVSAGGLHTCAVKTDHTLWCWGSNFYGQLGDGTTTNRTAPVQVSGHATDWAAVTAGASHTCAVRTDHTLWCWGLNGDGEFGNGTTTDSPVPVQVGGHAADWAAVTAGTGNTCAVKTDHTLWCWGYNPDGQVGDGSTTGRTVPVQVSGHAADWAAVTAGAAGASDTCAVRTNGTVWCWGDNTYDQLGGSTTTGSPVPVQVSGHATDWAAVTAGGDHTCAVKTDHTLWCWGLNNDDQLGDGNATESPVPVQVSGHAADWAAVTAGGIHTCAVKTDHTLWCWGDNTYGQVGDGSTTTRTVPVQVSGHAADWAAVTAGLFHTCAVKTDGTLWCWGWNPDGQLGDGTTTSSPVPVHVSGI
jgi:alpha-tubulin suppressor-like RCC1 family protein